LPVKAGFAIEPTHRVPAQVGKGAGGNAECNKHLCLRHRAHAEDRGADVKKRVGTARNASRFQLRDTCDMRAFAHLRTVLFLLLSIAIPVTITITIPVTIAITVTI